MPNELVLVTGATGFVGTHVTRCIVLAGYRVRATSRSEWKMKEWEKINTDCKGKIEWILVSNGSKPGAYDKAMKGVDYCIHTAAPFFFDSKNCQGELWIPIIEGTRTVMEAAKKEGSLKHMVLTSSFVALVDLSLGMRPGHCYVDDDWNPAIEDEIKESNNAPFVYCGAKAFEERMIFDDKDRKFSVSSINPSHVYGPVLQPIKNMEELNWSVGKNFYTLINSKEDAEIPPSPLPFHVSVDVRDVAELHLKALTDPRLKNKRVLTAGFFSYSTDFVESLRKTFANDPEKLARIPTKPGKDPKFDHYTYDASFAKTFLDRGEFIGLDECARDMAINLWDLEKKLSKTD